MSIRNILSGTWRLILFIFTGSSTSTKALEAALKEEREEEEYKLKILIQPGEQTISWNVTVNGWPAVCTEKYIDGQRISMLYEFNRPKLTQEELIKEWNDRLPEDEDI